MKFAMKEKTDFATRLAEANKVLAKNPDRLPIVVEKNPNSRLAPLAKNKFLVPTDMTVGQFHLMIRAKITLRPEDGLFFFVNDVIPSAMMTMGELYQSHHEEDNYLYMAYSDESVYGA